MGRLEDDDPFGAAPRKAPMIHVIGEALDAMSVDELDARIDVLRGEILRLEQARAQKKATRKAADAFFRS